MCLLLIQGCPQLRESLAADFRLAGYATQAVGDIDEAFVEATDRSHKVILFDVELPGPNWLELLRQMRAKGAKARILLLTRGQSVAERVNGLGIFNLLLSDSRCLYGYCSTELAWLTRKAPFGKASLIDTDLTVDFSKETTSKDIVTVIATRPLTRNEEWTVMKRDSLVVFRKGEPVFA